jgi:hypothetical protein
MKECDNSNIHISSNRCLFGVKVPEDDLNKIETCRIISEYVEICV